MSSSDNVYFNSMVSLKGNVYSVGHYAKLTNRSPLTLTSGGSQVTRYLSSPNFSISYGNFSSDEEVFIQSSSSSGGIDISVPLFLGIIIHYNTNTIVTDDCIAIINGTRLSFSTTVMRIMPFGNISITGRLTFYKIKDNAFFAVIESTPTKLTSIVFSPNVSFTCDVGDLSIHLLQLLY